MGSSLVAQSVESDHNAGDPGLIPGLGNPLEKEMATHCSILAWRIPWTEEPGGLQSMGSQRVRHDWVTNTFTFKETKESVCKQYKQMGRYTVFLDWKNQYFQDDYTIQSNLLIQWNPYQITNGIFHQTRTKNFKICMNTKDPKEPKQSWETKTELEESNTLSSKYSTKVLSLR